MAPLEQLVDFDILKKDVSKWLSQGKSSQPIISEILQRQELDLLKQTIKNERFFFVVDLQTFELHHVCGVFQYLGYPESTFTYRKYWNQVIHPGKSSLKLLARHLYHEFCKGTYPLKFLTQRFVSFVPLRHLNGQYILTKKLSSVFQFDQANRLLSYIDEFTIIGPYKDQPLSPQVYNYWGEQNSLAQDAIFKEVIMGFERCQIFSSRELQVARHIAYAVATKKRDIAIALNVQQSTVDTYCKRLIEKGEKFFHTEFDHVADVAEALKNEGLL